MAHQQMQILLLLLHPAALVLEKLSEHYAGPGAAAAAEATRPRGSREPRRELLGLFGAEDVDDSAELSAAVAAIAAMAQLGLGGADVLYPQSLDEYYAACEDELQWRVAL